MLRKIKTLSVMMVLCLCLAMIAPIFVAPPTASASSSIIATTIGALKNINYQAQPGEDTMGVIKVTLSDYDDLDAPTTVDPWIATVTLPSILASDNPALGDRIKVTYANEPSALQPGDVVLDSSSDSAPLGTFNIKIVDVSGDPDDDAVFYISFTDLNCENFSGAINISVLAGSTVFTTQTGIKIATVYDNGKTITSIKSIRYITSAGGNLDNISVIEVVPKTIEGGGIIKLKMESIGFSFKDAPSDAPNPTMSNGYWRFYGASGAAEVNKDEINFAVPADQNNGITKGMVSLSGVYIDADENVAQVGQDIEVSVSGAGVTEETIVVGQYEDGQTLNVANLSDLRVDGVTVDGFSPDILTYNVVLPYGTTSIPVVSATTQVLNLSFELYQADNLTGTIRERTAVVIVRSQDETVTKGYEITFSVDPSSPDCFIATAAYGSYLDPHVWVLRQFRDNILLHSSYGRWFVKEYYLHSPPIAAFIARHSSLRLLTRVALTPVIFAIAFPKISAIVLIVIIPGAIVLMSKRKFFKRYLYPSF